LLLSTAAEIVAVEPVAAMRQKLSDLYPPVAVIDGTAESIPVPHATADAVIAAQAFHWFHGPRALGAIHRVLKPNGMLGLIWNVRDESTAWVAKLSEIIDPHEQGVPRYKSMDWKRAFEASARFSPLQTIRFPHIQVATPDSIVDRVASISFIAALPPSTRAAVLGQVRELLRANPAMRGREQIDFPYHTDVYWCRALEA
jgi:SAM-dependent methyltransferase